MSTQYAMVSGRSPEELTKEVQKLVDEGFVPFFAPYAIVTKMGSVEHYQALTKEENSPPIRGTRGTGARGMS